MERSKNVANLISPASFKHCLCPQSQHQKELIINDLASKRFQKVLIHH